jgi:hypothetical protein
MMVFDMLQFSEIPLCSGKQLKVDFCDIAKRIGFPNGLGVAGGEFKTKNFGAVRLWRDMARNDTTWRDMTQLSAI